MAVENSYCSARNERQTLYVVQDLVGCVSYGAMCWLLNLGLYGPLYATSPPRTGGDG
jgi:hypothetical protein